MESTPSQTIGPFFHLCLTALGSAKSLVAPDAPGEHVRLNIRVLDGDGVPVNDAMAEVWQPDVRGFGRLATDESGCCEFETTRPASGRGPDDELVAPHVSVSVFARGLLKRAATRLYFAGDPANDGDPVLALVPSDKRATLLAHPDPDRPSIWNFEIRLCGDRETVFFDI